MIHNNPQTTYISPLGREFKVSAVGKNGSNWFSIVKFLDNKQFAKINYSIDEAVVSIKNLK